MTSYAEFLAAKMPNRVRAIIERCRDGETLCRTIIHKKSGEQEDAYHFEPSGVHAPTESSVEAIESGFLTAKEDGLFGRLSTQTWRAK